MKLWGGRFSKEPDKEFMDYSSSINLDSFLWREEILQNAAYSHALRKAGVLDENEFTKVLGALKTLYLKTASGDPFWRADDEDIHSAVERNLYELIGETAFKVHTGRSRNEQITTDLRLYLKRKIIETNSEITRALEIILDKALKHKKDYMPSYTHMQRAQPVSLAHYLLAWFFMIKRDFDRFVSCMKKLNFCPLGSGAVSGNSFNLDRELIADLLGFKSPLDNSIDAVSDRDFVVHFLSQSANLSIHLSRICEELVIWSTSEFGFVRLDEAYSTGSSLMPQKRNPDSAELIRAYSGRVIGAWVQVATTLKGLPFSYNRDLQEDRYYGVSVAESLPQVMRIFGKMILTATFNTERMKEALYDDSLYATDIADYLVLKGIPFRKAHELVGKVVKFAEQNKRRLSEIELDDLKKISSLFDENYYRLFNPEVSCAKKSSYGGTSLSSVKTQIEKARSIIVRQKEWLENQKRELNQIFQKVFETK